jgi:hypothetical protein
MLAAYPGRAGLDRAVLARPFSVQFPLELDLNGPLAGQDNAADFLPANPAAVGIAANTRISDETGAQLVSATIEISDSKPGDSLVVQTAGTNTTSVYANGILSLAGVDTLSNYQQVLRTAVFQSTAARPLGAKVQITFTVHDDKEASALAHSTVTMYQPGSATVGDRKIFYNNSAYDNFSAALGAADDLAIATDKVALLPGQTATFANYTSYNRGINGIMLDIAGAHGDISLTDFTFRVGNDNAPDLWMAAPTPVQFTVRAGAGKLGSDRVEIAWPDRAISDTWLQVNVAANGDTGFAAPEVFYFGNSVGEIGNSAANATMNALDALQTISHLLNPSNDTESITSRFDFNRDKRSTARDALIAVSQIIGAHLTLNLISTPALAVSSPLLAATDDLEFVFLAQDALNVQPDSAPLSNRFAPIPPTTPTGTSADPRLQAMADGRDAEGNDEAAEDFEVGIADFLFESPHELD